LRLLACLVLTLAAGCASLPQNVERTPTRAIADTAETRLGRAVAPAAAAHPGLTGAHTLANGRDAFAARVLLAGAAERSLDVQYYIWHGDTSGTLLAQALWDAAERGVRVRVLLDDANTQGEDDTIATLEGHANIEVRLYNPFPSRSWRLADFAADFSRLNRRMHNKSFTADNQFSVVGGRNIGDEYLGADSPVEFADLDVAVAGAAVADVSAEFDRYWNSESAYPASSLLPPATPQTVARVRASWAAVHESPDAQQYLRAISELPLVADALAGRLDFEWVPARVVSDDPEKTLHPPERRDLHMLPKLEEALGPPARELLIVSPYFVPTREGTAALLAIAQRGVSVLVLTNSLAATDVAPVYAGYSKYREDLLRGGVRLFELKGEPPAQKKEKDEEHRAVGGSKGGSSGASLHAKTFAVDGRRIFVGSFNFDPRSARLNTEMGVVLDSAALATRLSRVFAQQIPRVAYEVRLTEGGNDVEWIDRTEAGEVRYGSAPDCGLFKRMWSGFMSVLPIEWLL
jgi:putative cardiolipin synthase